MIRAAQVLRARAHRRAGEGHLDLARELELAAREVEREAVEQADTAELVPRNCPHCGKTIALRPKGTPR